MSMDIGTLTGAIELEDTFSPALEVISHNVHKVTDDIKESMNTTVLAFAGGAAAIVAGIGTAMASIGYLGEKGSVILGVEEAFDRLAKQAGSTGTAFAGALSQGVKGTVDSMELMQSTMRLLSNGVKVTTDDLKVMGEASRAMGKATGQDAAAGLQVLSQALLTGRTRGLAALGITVDLKKAEEDFAKSLGVTRQQLSDTGEKEARRIAILAATRDYVERLGESELSLKEKLIQARIAIGNWIEDLEKSIAKSPDVMRAMDDIGNAIKDALGDSSKDLLEVIIGSINAFARAISATIPYVTAFINIIKSAWEWIEQLDARFKISETVMAAVKSAWEFLKVAAEAIVVGIKLVWDWLVDLNDRFHLVDTAATIVVKAFEFLKDAFDFLKGALETAIKLWSEAPQWLKDAAVAATIAAGGMFVISKAVNSATEEFGHMYETMGTTATILSGLKDAVTSVVPVFGALTKTWGLATEAYSALMLLIEGHGIWSTFIILVKGGTAALYEMGVAAWAATGPFIIIGAALATIYAMVKVIQSQSFDKWLATSDSFAASMMRSSLGVKQMSVENYELEKSSRAAEQAMKDQAKAAKDIALPNFAQDALEQIERGIKLASSAGELGDMVTRWAKLGALPTEGLKKINDQIQVFKNRGETIPAVLQAISTSFENQAKLVDKSAFTTGKLTDEQKKYNEAILAYTQSSIGGNYLKTLDAIGNEMYEGIAYDLKRGRSTEELALVYKTTKTNIESVAAAEKKWAEDKALTQKLKEVELGVTSISQDLQGKLGGRTFDESWLGKMAEQLDMVNKSIPPPVKGFENMALALEGVGQKSTELEEVNQKIAAFEENTKRGKAALDTLAQGFIALGQASGGSLGQITSTIGQIIVATNNASKAGEHMQRTGIIDPITGQETWKKVEGNFGYMSTLFDKSASGADRMAAGVAAATTAIQGFSNMQAALQGKTKGQRVLGAASAGAQIGSIAGPWGTVIGAGVGALVGLFKGDPKWVKAQKEIGKSLGVNISDELAKTIADQSKTMGSLAAAELTNLSKIIQEGGGLTGANVDKMTTKLSSVFDLVQKKQLSLAEGTKVLDENWGAFAEAGTSSFGVLNKSLVEVIKNTEKYGIESKAITQYLGQQGQAGLQGFTKSILVGSTALQAQQAEAKKLKELHEQLGHAGADSQEEIKQQIELLTEDMKTQQGIISATAITNQSVADAMAAGIAADFAAMIDAGMSYADAIGAIEPAIEGLQIQMEAAGLSGSAVFDVLKNQVALYSDAIAGPALTAVDGLTQGMVALSNMGQLNQDTFAALSGQVDQTFSSLIAQGYDSTTVMLGMRDSLQRMWEEQQEFGYTTDDSTQALLDQAEAEGIVGEKHKSTSDQMLDATNRMADVLERMAEFMGVKMPDEAAKGAKGVQDHLDSIKPPTLHVPILYDDPGFDTSPRTVDVSYHEPEYHSAGGKVGVQYLAGGGEVVPFTPKGTDVVPAMLTPGEQVLSVDQSQNYENIMEGPSNADVVDAVNTLRTDLNTKLPRALARSMHTALVGLRTAS